MTSRRHRIAIVDDDEAVRKALGRLLRASNLHADSFASGQEFLDSLAASLPDCVVLDLQMPGMTGLDVQHKLALAGLRLPVVIVTAHDAPGMQARCVAAGASAYLNKPLDSDVLLQAIADAVHADLPFMPSA
jgi:FixJ family two-component response regulator